MTPNHPSLIALSLPLCLLSAACAGEPGSRLELKRSVETPEVFERVEFEVEGVPAAANPFDPESIMLDLEAGGPSGKSLHVPGFYHN